MLRHESSQSIRRLWISLAQSGSLKVSHILLGLVSTIVIANVLPVDEVGKYSFYISLATVLAIPATLGVPEVIVREAAALAKTGNENSIRPLLVWASRTIMSAASVTALIIVAWQLYEAHHGKGQNYAAAIFVAVLVIFGPLNAARAGVLIGLRKNIQGQLPEFLIRPAVFIALLLIFMSHGQPKFEKALLLYVLATLVSFTVGGILLKRSLPSSSHSSKQVVSDNASAWRKAALPLAFVSGMYVINQQMDILLLGTLSSDKEVGIYRVTSLMALMALVGQQFVRPVVAPRFAAAWNAQNLPELQRTAILASRVALTVALGVFLAYIAVGEWFILRFFGEEYLQGYSVLLILSAGQVISAAAGSTGNLLNMCGKERAALKGLAAGLVINLLCGVILIPNFGAMGAALGAFAGIIAWNVLLWRMVRSLLGVKPTAFGV